MLCSANLPNNNNFQQERLQPRRGWVGRFCARDFHTPNNNKCLLYLLQWPTQLGWVGGWFWRVPLIVEWLNTMLQTKYIYIYICILQFSIYINITKNDTTNWTKKRAVPWGPGAFEMSVVLTFSKFRCFDFRDHQIDVNSCGEFESGVGSKGFLLTKTICLETKHAFYIIYKGILSWADMVTVGMVFIAQVLSQYTYIYIICIPFFGKCIYIT